MTALPMAAPAPAAAAPAIRAPRRALLPSTAVGTLAPALLVSAGYVDPGNWGTDVAAGAQFGYRLVWVLALATGLALFLQYLSARLGLASGQDLASLLRTRLPRPARAVLIPPILGVLVVTEIVEVLGVVIGVQLLTGWSTGSSVAVATALVVTILVAPPGVARRTVYTCLGLVGAVYLTVLFLNGIGDVVAGLRPESLPPGGIVVAAGLIGAVVMPHNILLHSALARDLRHAADRRDGGQATPARLARLSRRSLTTTAAALGVAFAVNCAIMSITASGSSSGTDLAGALGSSAATFGAATTILFAITLIGAGLASSTAGGMVSADVISRLLPSFPAPPAVRRIACLVPAALIAGSGLPQVTVLVWSQVLLTVALPLVLVPLVWFSSERRTVGRWALTPAVRGVAIAVTGGMFLAGLASLLA
ncbi:Nramp family divalent metal transporter [Cryptosporangium minutisporangium]|uniref:Nramp family divalent metal transporter n=1 Tax=Cryptosporangium minutisporangium TaxID=113569 RepID=A0ABP6T5W3_9ACTN